MKSKVLFRPSSPYSLARRRRESSAGVVIERSKAATARQEGIVRVQLQIQLFIPGPTDDTEEAEKQRERARRSSTIWRPRNAT